MKKTLALFLVVVMLVGMLPAFSIGVTAAREPETVSGLTAEIYALPGIRNHDGPYKGVIGAPAGDREYCGYDGTQNFDATIDQLLHISANGNDTVSEDLNVFPPYKNGSLSVPGLDGYMIQWKGTVTAETAGTYYLVGHQVDNGFVAFVKQGDEMKKVYEYWAAYNWFDGAGEYALYSNLGGFTLEAGVATDIELWYLETGGGQGLEIGVSTSPDSGATTFGAAGISFAVTGTCWRTNIDADRNESHDAIKNCLQPGVTADGNEARDNNGCQASAAANHQFDATYQAIKDKMYKIGATVTADFESNSIKAARRFGTYGWEDLDDIIIDFSGYLTVKEGFGGEYQFGTRKVDNCLTVEIKIDGVWTRVYEFWAKNVWNDNGDTYYAVDGKDVTVTLEEGQSYEIRAYFLEINGGNPIETIAKINGTRTVLTDAVAFYTTKPENTRPSVDLSSIQDGLVAKVYQLQSKPDVDQFNKDHYFDIIGTTTGEGHHVSFDDVQRFSSSIDQLLAISKTVETDVAVTGIAPPLGRDGYITKWTGTVTAAADGTYYLVGHKVDNGFAMFVDQNGNGVFEDNELFYDYWAANHWFDAAGSTLVTNKGGFTLKAGEKTAVQMWYLEMGGGEGLEINASTNADGSGDKSFADAGFTFDLKRTTYTSQLAVNHDRINAVLPAGATSGNNADAANAGNHKYNESIAALKNEMFYLGSTIVPNYETEAFESFRKLGIRWDDFLVEYSGYVTATTGGEYQFGTSKVDNCLMVEIEIDGTWTRVYEFFAAGIWNDAGETFSDTKVTLEEMETYPIRVTFLEINGGEVIESKIKVNGETKSLKDSGLVFTTDIPEDVKVPTIKIFDETKQWYYTTSGETNETQIRDNAWMTDIAVYGAWDKTAMPITGEIWGTNDGGTTKQSLWAVTTFDIESLEAIAGYELMCRMDWDDNIRLYINGKLINVELGWSNGTATWSLAEEAADILVEGENTVAMKLVQGWGGASVNFHQLTLEYADNGNDPYDFKYIDKDGNRQDGRITTADEWLAYVADVNAKGKDNTRQDRISIEADLDFTGKTWVALDAYIGRIYGNGYTFSNITYTAKANAKEATEGKPIGLFCNSLTNHYDTGLIYDLNFENCTLIVNASEGGTKETSVIAGIVCGEVNRGCIENVTVSNSKILGNASIAGGIAGVASWNYDQKGAHVENCAVIDTQIIAKSVAGGILGYARGGDRVLLGNAYVENVAIKADTASLTVGANWGWGENIGLISLTTEGENKVYKTLSSEGEDYKIFFQTRAAEDGKSDVRIIVVAKKSWVEAQDAISAKIAFTAGETTKSTEQTVSTAYAKVTANGDGVTEVYTGDANTVIFGFVITDVPAEFIAANPTVTIQ